MPRAMITAKGIIVKSGSFVDMAGIDCRIALNKQKQLTTLENQYNKVDGRNVRMLYFVDLRLLDGPW